MIVKKHLFVKLLIISVLFCLKALNPLEVKDLGGMVAGIHRCFVNCFRKAATIDICRRKAEAAQRKTTVDCLSIKPMVSRYIMHLLRCAETGGKRKHGCGGYYPFMNKLLKQSVFFIVISKF